QEKLEEVNVLLESLREELVTRRRLYQEKIPSTFFISWLTLPAQKYAAEELLPARIILLTSYVGRRNNHIQELAVFLSDQIDKVISFREEYPAGEMDEQSIVRCIKRKSIPQTFYSGFKFIRTDDVAHERLLKAAIFDFLTRQKQEAGFVQQSPLQIKEKIEAFVNSRDDLREAFKMMTMLQSDKLAMFVSMLIFVLVMFTCVVFCVLGIFCD